MTPDFRRKAPRIHYEAPMRYALYKTDRFYESMSYNYSRDGLYFESDHCLEPESDVCIVMVNYLPGSFGPEAYKSYIAKIRWWKELPQTKLARFGVGAQLLAKSHDILGVIVEQMHATCDLCGKLTSADEVKQTEEGSCLCLNCFQYYAAIPEGIVKRSIARFLTGNVC